ncbi:glycosyltransferase [Exilibacterium tricleocarpae]|uniref:glycosyltransferase n=1 Tax=Exilibacterium tricleocarpae TaxID=2591008 RepID=UPI0015D4539A|nr:glycosyltransferase [Exilibacterium tricleocarpae]
MPIPHSYTDNLAHKFAAGKDDILRPFKRTNKPILIITNTLKGDITGVQTVMNAVLKELDGFGVNYIIIHPDDVPGPNRAIDVGVKIAFKYFKQKEIDKLVKEYDPIAIHIVNELFMSNCVRFYCKKNKIPFTTAYHTSWPEAANRAIGIPISWGEAFMRFFHAPAAGVMVPSKSVKERVLNMGFDESKVRIWSHGVNTDFFRPRDRADFVPEVREIFESGKGPYMLHVGRVSAEKNIEVFLSSNVKGTKIVVGDGPGLGSLKSRYKNNKSILFLGARNGEELAQLYSGADVFVFPSKVETYGLVQLEALSSGTPVAAFPAEGPKNVLNSKVGAMDGNLDVAIEKALKLDSADAREYSLNYCWKKTTLEFLSFLELLH